MNVRSPRFNFSIRFDKENPNQRILDLISQLQQENISTYFIQNLESKEKEEETFKALSTCKVLLVFANDKKLIRKITSSVSFGGGCINDTIIHLATTNMGFGGVGASGMGAYHGKVGFDTFSHEKSIVDKKTWLDLPMRYQPYKKFNGKLIRMFLK